MSERWPRLGYQGYQIIWDLEYLVPEYEAEWMLHVAERIESGQSLGGLSHNAAACFRHLAETPAAIKAMNHHRPRVPRNILGLNRAVHFLVRMELLGAKKVKRARSEIAAVWGAIEAATIKDDYGDFGKEASRIVEYIIADKKSESRDRNSILGDLDSDMTDRAGWMSKPQ